jgi:hypothetical protein
MSLYVVERDLVNVPPEQVRRDQQNVDSACTQLKAQGKRIRLISSAIVPVDGHGLDLFGAESAEVVKEAHDVAAIACLRIVEILDVTPPFVHRETSRSRRALQRTTGSTTGQSTAKRFEPTMTDTPAPELSRWLADGQRLFALCLEALERTEGLESRIHTLESENELLREELTRLRHKGDLLQTERAEMVAAFNDLAGHVTQVVDRMLQKSEDEELGK